MQKILIGFIALSLLFFVGCDNAEKNYKPVINEEQMVDLLVEIHLADATLNRAVNRGKINNSQVKGYYKEILEAHNITRAQFDSLYNYYSKDFDRFEKLYDDVILELQKRKKDIELEKRAKKDKKE